MTAIMTELTRDAILSSSSGDATTTLGIIAIVLLLVLLIQSEFLRALGGTRARLWRQTLNIVIGPLLFVFVLIVAVRIAEYLNFY